MANHITYVPILKWKMGEYQALSRLSPTVKNRVMPLLEVPPVGYDFEAQQQKKSHDDHLKDIGKRLYSKWQARDCFIDLKYIPFEARMKGGQHYVDFVFERLVEEGCSAIPVIALSSDAACVSAISKIQKDTQKGVCLRLCPEDFDSPKFPESMDVVLNKVKVGWAETDLVLDLVTPNYIPKGAYVRLLTSLMEMIPMLNRCRSVTVAGTSYPASIAALKPPFEVVARLEWTAYKAFVASLDSKTTIPRFGDYGVAHPELVELDMRLIKPFAKLRYTIDDAWHIARGSSVRKDGFEQYRDICAILTEQPYFSGRPFSDADAYIEDCAAGEETTGNLSTWVWVSTNRHITKVVRDLATLDAPSGKRGRGL